MEMGFVKNSEQEKLYNEIISKNDFNENQKEQIRYGLKNGLDVTVYAKSIYDWAQMEEIRLGLEKGLDISSYLNPGISWEEMQKIRKNLETKK